MNLILAPAQKNFAVDAGTNMKSSNLTVLRAAANKRYGQAKLPHVSSEADWEMNRFLLAPMALEASVNLGSQSAQLCWMCHIKNSPPPLFFLLWSEYLWQTSMENYRCYGFGSVPYVHRALKRLISRCKGCVAGTCSALLPDFGLK